MISFSYNCVFSSEDFAGEEKKAKTRILKIFSWSEEAVEEMARSWEMSKEEYLKKADECIAFHRKHHRRISGREKLLLVEKPDIENINAAFSESYGKVFTPNDFQMFKIKH